MFTLMFSDSTFFCMQSPSDFILNYLKFHFLLQFVYCTYFHSFLFPVKIQIILTCFALVWLLMSSFSHESCIWTFFPWFLFFYLFSLFFFWGAFYLQFIFNFIFYLFCIFYPFLHCPKFISLIWRFLYYQCCPAISISSGEALQETLW